MLPVAKGIPGRRASDPRVLGDRRGHHVHAPARDRQRRARSTSSWRQCWACCSSGRPCVSRATHRRRRPYGCSRTRTPTSRSSLPPLPSTPSSAPAEPGRVPPGAVDPRLGRGRPGARWSARSPGCRSPNDDGPIERCCGPASVRAGGPKVGDVAPDFSAPDARRQDGQALRLPRQTGGAELLGLVLPSVPRGVPAVPRPARRSTTASSWCSASTTRTSRPTRGPSPRSSTRRGRCWPTRRTRSARRTAFVPCPRRSSSAATARSRSAYYAQIPMPTSPNELAKITSTTATS